MVPRRRQHFVFVGQLSVLGVGAFEFFDELVTEGGQCERSVAFGVVDERTACTHAQFRHLDRERRR